MVVQRKWMYLESIFIGGDIRSQLPEEARKFDEIDKTFKKVVIDCTTKNSKHAQAARANLGSNNMHKNFSTLIDLAVVIDFVPRVWV